MPSASGFLVASLILGAGRLAFAAGSASPALLEAARNDDRSAVAALIGKRENVNAAQDDGSTALAWAAIRSNSDIVSLLLKAGANPNLVNEYGVGPLSLAIANGSTEIVRLLLDSEANPNLARESGETPLMTAARLGNVDMLKLLLQHGAEANARDKKFGQTALMWAAGEGHSAAVRLLVDHKADVRATTNTWDVKTTIFGAVTIHVGKTGIPWNTEGDYVITKGGYNALFFAVQKGDLESARILVDAGLDVNVASPDGATPLLMALYRYDSGPEQRGANLVADLPMARFLLDRGAKVNVADGAGYTPLHGAVLAVVRAGGRGSRVGGGAGRGGRGPIGPPLNKAEAMDMVRRLLEMGALPNRQTIYPTAGPWGSSRMNAAPQGSSALHVAAGARDVELLRLLADRGADPNPPRKDGVTPFIVAVQSNDVESVKELIARHADVAALNSEGQMAMHTAARAGASRVIEYLFSQGVPLTLKDKNGKTPLTIAEDDDAFRLAKAIEDYTPRPVKTPDTASEVIKRLLASRQ